MRSALSMLACATMACQPVLASDRDRPLVTFASKEPGADSKGVITERELRSELARLRFEREGQSLKAAPLPPELKTSAVDRLIERRILLLEANRLGVRASTTAAAAELAAMRTGMGEAELQQRLLATLQTEDDLVRLISERRTVEKLLAEVAHAGVRVTPAEIDAAWTAVPESERMTPLRVRASQVVVVTEEEGKQVLDELKKGASFAEVALRHGVGPEAARGGDLGWVEAGGMPDAFLPLLTLEVGKVSGLVSSEYGFHVFKVVAREEPRARTLEEARPGIEAKLLRAKLEAAEAAYIAKLVSHHDVERKDRAIARID